MILVVKEINGRPQYVHEDGGKRLEFEDVNDAISFFDRENNTEYTTQAQVEEAFNIKLVWEEL